MMLPRPLFFRLILIFLIGISCFSVGFLLFFLKQDRILLYLSILLLFFSVVKSLAFYHSLRKMDYLILEGVCTNVAFYPFSRSCHLFLQDSEGNTSEVTLPKKYAPRIGISYRVYLRKTAFLTENRLPDRLLMSDSFLGIESISVDLKEK